LVMCIRNIKIRSYSLSERRVRVKWKNDEKCYQKPFINDFFH